MSSAPERPSGTLPGNPSSANEDATASSPPGSADTAAYVPQEEAKGKLPTEFPAPFGRYQLLKLLGKGGMGAVYLAHDTQLDRPVALKVPLFRAEEGSQVLARFLREARSAATLHHANVCPVYDVGEWDGVPYLTMAYIEGKSLGAWVRSNPLTQRQSAALIHELALALEEAHNKGVIHRDLKPANIMIDQRSEPVIMDFGLARRNRSGDARLTQKGEVMGTPAYMAPEQVSGDPDAVGPACDIYSLGVILYELVAGQLPFTGDSMTMLAKVLLQDPPPPSKLCPELDAALETICLKAIAKKGEDRYASMADFAAALQEYLRSTRPVKADQAVRWETEDSASSATTDWRPSLQPAPEASPTLKVEQSPAPDRPPQRGRWLWRGIIAGTVGFFLLAVVLVFWPKRPYPIPLNSGSQPSLEDSIFNGKDLAGWEAGSGNPALWNVRDGTMGVDLPNPSRPSGWLVTQRDYTDFLFRFEFQLWRGAESGVGLRMWPGSPKPLKIQIQDDRFPAFAGRGAKERTGALYGVAGSPGTGVGLRDFGQWNRMEIELRGWRLRVAVNGKSVLDFKLNDDSVFRYLDGAPPASGRIGLQHGQGQVRFRNLAVEDLAEAGDASTRKEIP